MRSPSQSLTSLEEFNQHLPEWKETLETLHAQVNEVRVALLEEMVSSNKRCSWFLAISFILLGLCILAVMAGINPGAAILGMLTALCLGGGSAKIIFKNCSDRRFLNNFLATDEQGELKLIENLIKLQTNRSLPQLVGQRKQIEELKKTIKHHTDVLEILQERVSAKREPMRQQQRGFFTTLCKEQIDRFEALLPTHDQKGIWEKITSLQKAESQTKQILTNLQEELKTLEARECVPTRR